jgi:hypothetical protein
MFGLFSGVKMDLSRGILYNFYQSAHIRPVIIIMRGVEYILIFGARLS